MAHRKAGGTAKNLRDSNPQYLGVKRQHGQKVSVGEIIIRQKGTKYMPGKNVGLGKDYTIFSLIEGKVSFYTKCKSNFTGIIVRKKYIDVIQ